MDKPITGADNAKKYYASEMYDLLRKFAVTFYGATVDDVATLSDEARALINKIDNGKK